MASKGRVAGYGSTVAKNVFKVTFVYPLSSKVHYEAYDNAQTFPQTDTLTTTGNDVFGLGAGEYPMIALRDTTNGTAGAGTNWFPASPNANTATINFLKGLVYYVTQQGATLSSAGGSITFNMQASIPASAQTDSSMQADIVVRYTFTSTTPNVTWWFNSVSDSGTMYVPVWATMIPDSHGIYHTKIGLTVAPYLANIPETGQEKTLNAWISD